MKAGLHHLDGGEIGSARARRGGGEGDGGGTKIVVKARLRGGEGGEGPPSNIPISATTESFFEKLDKKSIVNHHFNTFPAL